MCPLWGAPRFAFAHTDQLIDWEAQLDLCEVTQSDQINSNFFSFAENPFHAVRLRFSVDGRIHEHVSAFVELLSDEGRAPRLFGGFVRLSDPGGHDFNLEIGKIPLHVGAYPNRSTAQKNPLVGSPIVYQYHVDVRDDQIPIRPEDIVMNQGRGYFTNYGPANGGTGVGYPGTGQALSVLYENCWDFGAVFVGTANPLEFALGLTNGTVGSMVGTDTNDGKQVLGRIGLMPVPWLRAGVSAARGPYLIRQLDDAMPAGRSVNDYNQVFAGADLELSYDRVVLNGEYVWNRFEQPYVGDLDLNSWFAEGKVTLIPGWYVAGRYSSMIFNDLILSNGLAEPWDAPLWRQEIGLGFKPSKMLLAKLIHQETHIATTPRRVESFMAAQLSVVF